MDPGTILITLAVAGGLGLITSLRILFEYERGVIFRLGKLTRAKGPGLIFLVPFGVERARQESARVRPSFRFLVREPCPGVQPFHDRRGPRFAEAIGRKT